MSVERRTVAAAYQKIEAHEALCAERYRGIEEKLHWVLGGLGALALGLMAWMAVQLYTLEPLRVAALRGPPPLAPALAPVAPASNPAAAPAGGLSSE